MIDYVICVRRDEESDLQVGKVYRRIPDLDGEELGLYRIVDDSGEDYLYPVPYFAPIALPVEIANQIFSEWR